MRWERLWAEGKNVFDIDVVGGLRIKKKFQRKPSRICEASQCGRTEDSFEKKRKTESDEKSTCASPRPLSKWPRPHNLIIILNDDLEKALKKAEALVAEHIAKNPRRIAMKGPKHIGLYFGTFNPIHIGIWWLPITWPNTPTWKKSGLWLHPIIPTRKTNPLGRRAPPYPSAHCGERLPQTKGQQCGVWPSPTQLHHSYFGASGRALSWGGICFDLRRGQPEQFPQMEKPWGHPAASPPVCVYPASPWQCGPELLNHPHIHRVAAPIMELSATFIRNALKEGKNVPHATRPCLAIWTKCTFTDDPHYGFPLFLSTYWEQA